MDSLAGMRNMDIDIQKEKPMEKTVETIVKHPIASIIVITSIMRGIAAVIVAARGGTVQPIVLITNNIAKDLCDVKTEV